MQSMPNYYTAAYAPLSPYPAAVSEVTSSPNTGSTVLTIQTPPRALVSNTEQETTTSPSAKRNQVKNACTNCQKACKKCDDARPCPRCIKYGVSDTCVNSVRKERKKGIKRGPYKRRQKNSEEGSTLVKSEAATATTPTTTFKIREPVSVSTVTTAATSSSTPVDYGYPTNLSQYAQSYETYQQYAAAAAVAVNNTSETKEVYIVAPVYPGFNNEDGNAYFALPPQGPPPPPGVYFQKEEKKQQPMTPVPSTSNSSGTTSPSETPQDDEDTKFARLTQLCSAALRENKEAEAATQAAQQKEIKQEQE